MMASSSSPSSSAVAAAAMTIVIAVAAFASPSPVEIEEEVFVDLPPTTAAATTSQNLLLDSQIRDWVVLPLLVIMIAAGLLRHHLGQILRTSRKPLTRVETRARSCLQRCQRLRGGGGGFLSRVKWEARRRYFSSREPQGYLREEAERIEHEKESGEGDAADESAGDSSGGADAMNPMAMMDGVKGNMAFMVQNMVMMQGISHFFRGFVLVKVPFPLTNGFKMMFQRGLDLTTLDTSYVSSVSWYFLVMFGLRAFFRLVIGDPPQEVQESAMMQHSFGVATSAPPGPAKFDAPAALRAEADNLEIARQSSSIDDAERRLLGKRYPKKKRAAGLGAGDDFFGFGAPPPVKSSQSKKNR